MLNLVKSAFGGLRFFSPGFLYFLPLALLPLLIHLLSRKKAVVYIFPSVSLLKKDALSRTADFNIMSVLLLLIRTAALFFLVLYFAGPSFVLGKKQARSGETAVFVDYSYSMNRDVAGSTLWEEAQNTAGAIVNSLRAEKPSLFVFNRGFSFAGRGAGGLDGLFAKKKPADVSACFSEGLSQFLSDNRSIKRVFVVSDFAPGVFRQKVRIPDDTQIICLKTGSDAKNFYVKSCKIFDKHLAVFPACLPGGKEDYAVSVLCGSRRVNTVTVSAQSGSIAVPREYLSGRIEIDNADVLPEDNVFFYSRQNRRKTVVPVLHGGTGLFSKDGAYFIRKIIERSPFFSAGVTSDLFRFRKKLKTAAAAVMTNPSGIYPELSGEIREWVARGGLLILFPGGKTVPEEMNREFSGFLPGRLYPVKGGGLTGVSLDIPWAKDDFTAEHYEKLDVLKFFPVRCREDALELIKAGGETVASAVRFGDGAVILFSVSADMEFSNLPVVSGFPPFLLRSLEYFVYERKEFRRNYFVGEKIHLPADVNSLMLAGAEIEIKNADDGSKISAPVDEPGLYDAAGASGVERIAVNLVRNGENNLSAMTERGIKKLFPGAEVFNINNPEKEIAHILRGKNMSAAVLFIFMALLCAEIFIA
ncbi:MAG: BatA domain-containing protein, partial [Elusimicrobiota bacterium]|nr:BatA domain-containing protein [Elusimicrobiota bacterium]